MNKSPYDVRLGLPGEIRIGRHHVFNIQVVRAILHDDRHTMAAPNVLNVGILQVEDDAVARVDEPRHGDERSVDVCHLEVHPAPPPLAVADWPPPLDVPRSLPLADEAAGEAPDSEDGLSLAEALAGGSLALEDGL